jgi:D-sedoheptulose 7-phosphate isomerase
VGRYETERKPYPAVALTTDTSALTAIANDYGYDAVFARQVSALGLAGDTLIAISTSGNSRNVVEAVKAARAMRMRVVALTGDSGGSLADLADICIRVPSKKTAHIQECHIAVAHAFCATVDHRTLHEETESRAA